MEIKKGLRVKLSFTKGTYTKDSDTGTIEIVDSETGAFVVKGRDLSLLNHAVYRDENGTRCKVSAV